MMRFVRDWGRTLNYKSACTMALGSAFHPLSKLPYFIFYGAALIRAIIPLALQLLHPFYLKANYPPTLPPARGSPVVHRLGHRS